SDCFFFQAEDGIRDFHVTGVQTYALPILITATSFLTRAQVISEGLELDSLDDSGLQPMSYIPANEWYNHWDTSVVHYYGPATVEIGRASCRERVWSAVS